MTDFNELMKQAQQMQEQFKEAQLNLVSLIVEGQSGAGLVSIKINGRHDVVGVSLDDSIMSEDKSFVEDLIAAAFNDAVRKLEDESKETMGSMASGFKLPEGFKFPF
ncbi:MAG TPA: YbaB/EbfC family nucleoid-associated protein [Gammaproteobacteria bacterium]|nr:YbaB/EbfC family nucleoid-associated protein [Gammaproteobacteria bacterium]HCA38032.1 YbaB/EbfC family nucleoid-associated protein [Gammaproteobacteria bacterium]|tara:strand:- start:1726 stop:2046 length:321 start_codon:yes stop_codon:yes gene_type:complete